MITTSSPGSSPHSKWRQACEWLIYGHEICCLQGSPPIGHFEWREDPGEVGVIHPLLPPSPHQLQANLEAFDCGGQVPHCTMWQIPVKYPTGWGLTEQHPPHFLEYWNKQLFDLTTCVNGHDTCIKDELRNSFFSVMFTINPSVIYEVAW